MRQVCLRSLGSGHCSSFFLVIFLSCVPLSLGRAVKDALNPLLSRHLEQATPERSLLWLKVYTRAQGTLGDFDLSFSRNGGTLRVVSRASNPPTSAATLQPPP